MIGEVETRHGFTLTDLDRLTRIAVEIAYPRALDYCDRYDAAWHAIAELLCSADEPPTPSDLKMTGAHAVELLASAERHHRGYDRRNLIVGAGGMPAFQRYWKLTAQHALTFEGTVVDRIAFRQIWPTLTPAQQETVLAYAVHESHTAAAVATRRPKATYRIHLRDARKRFRGLWFEHETDPGLWARTYGRNDRNAVTVISRRRRRRDGE